MLRGRCARALGLLGMILVATWSVSYGQDAKKGADTPFPNTPEGAVQNFILAMATGNERELQALTLPLPDGDFAWLLKGEHLPAEQYADFRKAVAEEMKFRVGRPGEKLPMNGKRQIEIKPEEFGPDRSVVVHDGAPLPTRVRKVEGRWKVNAAPMVAGRKAATAARKRAEEAAAKAATKAKP